MSITGYILVAIHDLNFIIINLVHYVIIKDDSTMFNPFQK